MSDELTSNLLLDPKYEEEVSGCTAAVAVISRDKIRVVCPKEFHLGVC